MDEIRILVVEDEVLLKELLGEILTEASFVMIGAPNGEQAVEILEREGDQIRALITDINLGGKVNGWHVAHEARKINSSIPVIYTTSCTPEEWAAHGVPNSVHIVKPFVPAQIITAISQLLNSTSTLGS